MKKNKIIIFTFIFIFLVLIFQIIYDIGLLIDAINDNNDLSKMENRIITIENRLDKIEDRVDKIEKESNNYANTRNIEYNS